MFFQKIVFPDLELKPSNAYERMCMGFEKRVRGGGIDQSGGF